MEPLMSFPEPRGRYSSLRRSASVLFTAAVVVLLGLSAPAHAEEPLLVIDGRGWGHGVGLSQEGARTLGAGGATTEEILATFYPGTRGGIGRGTVRVRVLESGGRSQTLAFPVGGELLARASDDQPPGFPVVVAPGGSVEVSYGERGLQVLRLRDRPTVAAGAFLPMRLISSQGQAMDTPVATLPPGPTMTTTTAAPPASAPSTTAPPLVGPPVTAAPATTATTTPAPPTTSAPASSSTVAPTTPAIAVARLWAVPRDDGATIVASRARRYRGAIEVLASPTGGIELINHVDVESYLRGMGEVLDPSWPPAALRAQTVAARTYALRATGADYDLCDDDRCQVYIGQGAEYPAMDRAVAESRGHVLLYDGILAATFYSANAGGVSATAEEGFGPGGASYPYLRSGPYQTADPDPWTERARLADVERRLAYPGRLSGAEISASGPSGRATEITLHGDAGAIAVDGRTFAFRMDLKSTLFTLRAEVGQSTSADANAAPTSQGQDLAALLPSRSAGNEGAVPISAGRPAQGWAERHMPLLLLALSLDLAVIGHRVRSRSRRRPGASLHAHGGPSSHCVLPMFPPEG